MSEYIARPSLMAKLTSSETQSAMREMDGSQAYSFFLAMVNSESAADVVEVKHGRCKFCGGQDNAFHILNAETAVYSGIELAINRQGMLRVRVYDDYECETALPQSSEIIMISACPNCGADMRGGNDGNK